jgi:hypothetical protein
LSSLSLIPRRYEQNYPGEYQKVDNGWTTRSGVALALSALAASLTKETATRVFDFLINESLFDCNDEVNQQMLAVGIDIATALSEGNLPSEYVIALSYLSSLRSQHERPASDI